MAAFWIVFARVMVSLELLCSASFSKLDRPEFDVSWVLVEVIVVTEVVVDEAL